MIFRICCFFFFFFLLRFCLLSSLSGDSGVGKSCLILRLCDDSFSQDPVVSIGGEFREKDIVVDGKTVRLQLWDTAGQERYRVITSSFYHNAKATIIVYDVTNKETFDNVPRWNQEVDHYLDPEATKIVVGNKSDLENRSVTKEDADEVCDNIGTQHHLVSAKSGSGVNDMFLALCRELLLRSERAGAPDSVPPTVVTMEPPGRTGCCVLQ